MKRLSASCASALLLAAVAACVNDRSFDDGLDGGTVDAQAAFVRMKTLAGSHDASVGESEVSTVAYEVTSAGHALLEKLNVGSADDEMTSIYFLEGRDLAMVHYCSAGNRPHLRLDRAHSTLDDLRFEWDDGATDVDPVRDGHIHSVRFRFDGKLVTSDWVFWVDGQPADSKTFVWSQKAAPPELPPATENAQ